MSDKRAAPDTASRPHLWPTKNREEQAGLSLQPADFYDCEQELEFNQ